MSSYREFRFWSPSLGCDAARLSIANAHGGELFKIIPVAAGRAYREARDAALDEIEDAIARGDEPGEVGDEKYQEG